MDQKNEVYLIFTYVHNLHGHVATNKYTLAASNFWWAFGVVFFWLLTWDNMKEFWKMKGF